MEIASVSSSKINQSNFNNAKVVSKLPSITLSKVATSAFFGFLLASLFLPQGAEAKALGVAAGAAAALCLASSDLWKVKEESCPSPLDSFSPLLGRIAHPGLFPTTKGDAYCKIPAKKIFTQEQCDATADDIGQVFKRTQPETYNRIMKRALSIGFEQESAKGFLVGGLTPGKPFAAEISPIEHVAFAVSPAVLKDHKAAIAYLQKTVLRQEDFFQKDSADIIKTMKKTHEIMLRHALIAAPGQFRTEDLFITADHVKKDFEGYKKELLANGGTANDVRILKGIWAKMISRPNWTSFCTEEELAVFKKIAFFPPAFEKIPAAMKVFADQLKIRIEKMRNGEADVVETAAWAHQEIGRIHPFLDGNGRMARAWMSTILQLGGIRGVIFPDDAEYTQAIIAEQRGVGSFADYLREMIRWNNQNFVDDSIRR